MFRCIIEYLTHGTKEGPTNYEAPSHPRGGVQVTSIVLAAGGCRDLAIWWGCMWLRGGRAEEMDMEDSLDESGSTSFGDRWSCRLCNIRSLA